MFFSCTVVQLYKKCCRWCTFSRTLKDESLSGVDSMARPRLVPFGHGEHSQSVFFPCSSILTKLDFVASPRTNVFNVMKCVSPNADGSAQSIIIEQNAYGWRMFRSRFILYCFLSMATIALGSLLIFFRSFVFSSLVTACCIYIVVARTQNILQVY